MKKEYTIGEISKLYNLGQDSLRYYEKKGLIHPKRKDNGYRAYTLEDIWRLNLIKDLRKLDFSIEQIKAYLENRTRETTMDLMRKEVQLIEKEIEPLLDLKKNIESKLKTLEKLSRIERFNQIEVREIDERKIILTEVSLRNDQEVDLAFRHLEKRDERNLSLIANREMGVFIADRGIEENNYMIYQRAFFLVEKSAKQFDAIIPAGKFLTLMYQGQYKKSQQMFENIFKYIEDKAYELAGNPMEIYRIDIHGTSIEEEFITEIQIPIKDKEGNY